MPNIRIIPGSNFNRLLEDGVTKNVFNIMERRLISRENQISNDIGEYIISIFESTDVVKSLRGKGSVDLQAHFGLSDGLSNQLVDGMILIIRNSIKLSSRPASDNPSIQMRIIDTDWEKYIALPGARYFSSPSNIEIPVIEWLLVDPAIDIGAAAYDIVFRGHSPKFDTRIEKVSRSGRAIMASLESLGGSSGYVLPDIISKNAGLNFIEYAIGQQGVANRVGEIVFNGLK